METVHLGVRQVCMCPYIHVLVPLAYVLVQDSHTLVIDPCYSHQCASARFGHAKWPFNFLLTREESPAAPVAVQHPGVMSLAGQEGLQGKEACSKLARQMFQCEHQGKGASASQEPDIWVPSGTCHLGSD